MSSCDWLTVGYILPSPLAIGCRRACSCGTWTPTTLTHSRVKTWNPTASAAPCLEPSGTQLFLFIYKISYIYIYSMSAWSHPVLNSFFLSIRSLTSIYIYSTSAWSHPVLNSFIYKISYMYIQYISLSICLYITSTSISYMDLILKLSGTENSIK